MAKKYPHGTNNRRALDAQRFGTALAQPGIDTRHWVSYGTVCVLTEDGEKDFTDRRAVYVGPEGVEVDVSLEPLDVNVPCKYSGVQGGPHAQIITPIMPGDRVLVGIPDGDLMNGAVILAVLNSSTQKVPLESSDRKPVFRNDRVLVYAGAGFDIDVRTQSGATMTIAQSGDVTVKTNVSAGKATVVSDHIQLGADGLHPVKDGLVHGSGIDPFTGSPYYALHNASTVVLGRKS